MTRWLDAIATPHRLWIFAALTVGLHVAIHMARAATGIDLMDFELTGDGARAVLSDLAGRPGGLAAHAWITGALDMPYAMAYGGLVAGLCYRFARRAKSAFALPALIAAGCDVTENAVQLLALFGTADLLDLKLALTPLKFGLIAIASAFAVVFWARHRLQNTA